MDQEINDFMLELQQKFLQSADFVARPMAWWSDETVILCFYSSLVNKKDVDQMILFLKERTTDTQAYWGESMLTTVIPYDEQKLITALCNGETAIIRKAKNEIILFNMPEFAKRSIEEPVNEHAIRGTHEGFIETVDANLSIMRRHIKNPKFVVKEVIIGKKTNATVYYMYLEDMVDQDALKTVEERLYGFDIDEFYSVGQLADHLDDKVWSPFPQLLSTERPDRVKACIFEGKIAIMTDLTPTVLVGPITFFTFYQTPDDYNGRPIVGTFYKILRIASFFTAVFLPAVYIAVIAFHFEVFPLELSNQVKVDVNKIPYHPLLEAMILEITIELIREASIRLPQSVGQTIGIVGGLVIGDAIVSAGLVSNMMVIVVAFTAISSFVVPTFEFNAAIRILRFPFMLIASLFGFFGIVIGFIILVIHLFNLSSLNRPYMEPLIPANPKKFYKIFVRDAYVRPSKQSKSFSPQKDE